MAAPRLLALHRDVHTSRPADAEYGGYLFGAAGSDENAGLPAVSAGVVDAATVEHIGIRADVRRADDLSEAVSQRFGHRRG